MRSVGKVEGEGVELELESAVVVVEVGGRGWWKCVCSAQR